MALSMASSSAPACVRSRSGAAPIGRRSGAATAVPSRASSLRVAAFGRNSSQFTTTSSSSSYMFAVPLLQRFSSSSSSNSGRRSSSGSVACHAADPASSSGAPEGQITSALMASMQAKIADALEAQSVTVTDVYGDGRHVSIDVVAAAFEGKNAVARQRLVYKAIWMELQEAVHAVDAMTTKTPEEAAAAGGK